MIIRLNRLLLYFFMLILFAACGAEEEVVNQPINTEEELFFVATIGKSFSRTLYTEGQDVNNNNRPYLKALWGGEQQTTESILLYTEAGVYCGTWNANIKAGGEPIAMFKGVLNKDGSVPHKAYYGKKTPQTALYEVLDLTKQKQGASGSTAHISGQDFMIGEIKSLPNAGTDGSIEFRHLTGALKYTLTFPQETEVSNLSDIDEETNSPLLVEMLSLKQASGEPALQLQISFDGKASNKYSSLDLRFKEDNGMVSVPMDNQTLVAYASFFASQTQNVPFTVFARTTTGLYETAQFEMNQNLEAGKLYTLTANMNRLTQYDWYFNPELDEKGNYIYTITDADEMAAFAKIVNGEAGLKEPDSFENKTVKMANDISLEKYQPWTPIGKTESTPFKGTFDGGKHTISDLKTDPNKDYQGLFGFVDGATIKNLTIEGQVEGQNYVGAFAASATNSTFSDCTFGSSNMSEFSITGLDWVGSIIGYAQGSVIQYCSNYGKVTGHNYVGGLGGFGNESSLRGSSNYGGVYMPDGGIGGGLMGGMNGGHISGCANHGATTSMASEMYSILGGIVGEMANQVHIIGSYSDGEMPDYGWGIGYGDGIIDGSYFTDGQGDSEYYRETITSEERDAMNALIAGEGVMFDENGNLIVVTPTDFGSGNVGNFEGGGYLK